MMGFLRRWWWRHDASLVDRFDAAFMGVGRQNGPIENPLFLLDQADRRTRIAMLQTLTTAPYLTQVKAATPETFVEIVRHALRWPHPAWLSPMLQAALVHGDLKLAQALVEAGANPEFIHTLSGYSVFIAFAYGEFPDASEGPASPERRALIEAMIARSPGILYTVNPGRIKSLDILHAFLSRSPRTMDWAAWRRFNTHCRPDAYVWKTATLEQAASLTAHPINSLLLSEAGFPADPPSLFVAAISQGRHDTARRVLSHFGEDCLLGSAKGLDDGTGDSRGRNVWHWIALFWANHDHAQRQHGRTATQEAWPPADLLEHCLIVDCEQPDDQGLRPFDVANRHGAGAGPIAFPRARREAARLEAATAQATAASSARALPARL